MAAESVDRDNSTLVKLGAHASRLVDRFIALEPAEHDQMAELLVELRQVTSEFRRLCPSPMFRKQAALHVVRWCSICRFEITQDRESFETFGAVYHVDCFARETAMPKGM